MSLNLLARQRTVCLLESVDTVVIYGLSVQEQAKIDYRRNLKIWTGSLSRA